MNSAGKGQRVLLVDDDETFRRVLSVELARRGHTVDVQATGQGALERGLTAETDVVLLDLQLPDLDGIQVLKRLRERDVPVGVIMLTGHGTIDTAIHAIRLGAEDYLEKPCPIDKIDLTIRKTRENLDLRRRHRILSDGYSPTDVRAVLVGQSDAFRKLCESVARIAVTDATVLILGETGAGKDLVAKLLHAESARRDAPFVVVDCAALHEELLQSELFGHEKGAFSGAARQKHGLFEVAAGGTLFLDEIGEMSLQTQAKLLRVLESHRFRRLGGNQEIAVDLRVVSATNRDLQGAIAGGRFRSDLYFRLATLTLDVPPLRERREDIPLLIEHFTERFNRRFSRESHFSDKARELLVRCDWPGNVRELIHVVEQAIVLCDKGEVGPEDLPELGHAAGAAVLGERGEDFLTLDEVDRRHVLTVLEHVQGNRARAARILQVSERNLYRLIRRYEGSTAEQDPGSAES
jgi:DNA-binding NtrC family response regulator